MISHEFLVPICNHVVGFFFLNLRSFLDFVSSELNPSLLYPEAPLHISYIYSLYFSVSGMSQSVFISSFWKCSSPVLGFQAERMHSFYNISNIWGFFFLRGLYQISSSDYSHSCSFFQEFLAVLRLNFYQFCWLESEYPCSSSRNTLFQWLLKSLQWKIK